MTTNLEEMTQTVDATTTSTSSPELEADSIIDSKVETQEKVTLEEFTISGDSLVAKIKELIHRGNIRRIIIKNEDGHTLIEIPMTVGVIGGVISAAFFPVVAAIGVIGAMVAHLTVVVEKREAEPPSEPDI